MIIKYNPIQDLKNWFRIKEKYPDNFTITEFYPFDKSIELSQNNFDKILKTVDKKKIEKFNRQAELIEKKWQQVGDEIIKKITDYLKVPFEKIDFKVNLTTAYLMPYDKRHNWFMIPTHKKLEEQIKSIAHELFHLYHLKNSPSLPQEKLEKEVQRFLSELI
jgi:predicted RNA-binding protein Jag